MVGDRDDHDGRLWSLSPVTPMDRFVAVLLMLGGVALIGVVTATLALWVVGLVAEETAEQEAATRTQVAELGL